MGRVIRFNPDRHQEAQRLLPWYASGQLDADERALVETHLRECRDCQTDLRRERELAEAVAELPFDAEHGWSEMRRRIQAEGLSPQAPRPFGRLARAVRAPGRLGWAVAAQFVLFAAGLALVAPIARQATPRQPAAPAAQYHALGSPSATPAGDVIVIFRPDATAEDLSKALRDSGARLVDGPTAADAYVLDVPQARRSATIAQLRANGAVTLAEAIDPQEPR